MHYELKVSTRFGNVNCNLDHSELNENVRQLIISYDPECTVYRCGLSTVICTVCISFEVLKQIIKDSQKLTGVELADYIKIIMPNAIFCKRCNDTCYAKCETCGNLPQLENGIGKYVKNIKHYIANEDGLSANEAEILCELLLMDLYYIEKLTISESKPAQELLDIAIEKMRELLPDMDINISIIFSERGKNWLNLEIEGR